MANNIFYHERIDSERVIVIFEDVIKIMTNNEFKEFLNGLKLSE